MLVTLGAFQANPEKSSRRFLAPFLNGDRLLPSPEKIEAGALGIFRGEAFFCFLFDRFRLAKPLFRRKTVPAGLAENALHNIVVWHILGDPLTEPIVPQLPPDRVLGTRTREGFCVVPCQIAELARPRRRLKA